MGVNTLKVVVTNGMGKEVEKEIQIKTISGKDLLEKLGINLFDATIMKNNEIVTENETLTNEDKIKIVNFIFGG